MSITSFDCTFDRTFTATCCHSATILEVNDPTPGMSNGTARVRLNGVFTSFTFLESVGTISGIVHDMIAGIVEFNVSDLPTGVHTYRVSHATRATFDNTFDQTFIDQGCILEFDINVGISYNCSLFSVSTEFINLTTLRITVTGRYDGDNLRVTVGGVTTSFPTNHMITTLNLTLTPGTHQLQFLNDFGCERCITVRVINLVDPDPRPLTVSYSQDEDMWTSFHSYSPSYFTHNDEGLFSFISSDTSPVYKHNENDRGVFFENLEPFMVDVVLSSQEELRWDSIEWQSIAERDGIYSFGDTFTHCTVDNFYQSSGRVTLDPQDTSPMYNRDKWVFNEFKDRAITGRRFNKGILYWYDTIENVLEGWDSNYFEEDHNDNFNVRSPIVNPTEPMKNTFIKARLESDNRSRQALYLNEITGYGKPTQI